MYYIRDMDTLAKRLIWAREQKGLTQAALAKQSGVGQSTIGNLESGIRSTARRIIDIARVLDVDPAWLANGEGAAQPAEAPHREAANEGRAIVSAQAKASRRDEGYGTAGANLEDVSVSTATAPADLTPRERLLVEMYRRSNRDGRLMIFGAATVASNFNSAALMGSSEDN